MRKATLGIFALTATLIGLSPVARASDAEVKQMIQLINQERQSRGLRPLRESGALDRVSHAHSADMLAAGFFSHESPNTGSPTDRLRAAGVRFRVAAENIALDASIPEAHKHLMESPGHRRNILLPDVTHVGIGVTRRGRHIYVTQTFAHLSGAAAAPGPVAQPTLPAQPVPPPAPAAPPPAPEVLPPAPPAPLAPAPLAPALPPPPAAAPQLPEPPPPAAQVQPELPPGPRALRYPRRYPGRYGVRARRPRLQVVQTPYGRMCVLNHTTVAPCRYVRRILRRQHRQALRAERLRQRGLYGAPQGGFGGAPYPPPHAAEGPGYEGAPAPLAPPPHPGQFGGPEGYEPGAPYGY